MRKYYLDNIRWLTVVLVLIYHVFYLFKKTKGNTLTSEAFVDFIRGNEIAEFFIAGADAIACVKLTCYNMAKAGYKVHVLSDCITSYDKRKIDEMLKYYASKGCIVEKLNEAM